MFNRKDFNKRVQGEYEEFLKQTLKLEKQDIYNKAFEIFFKTRITESLQEILIVDNDVAEFIDNLVGENILELFYTLQDEEEGRYTFDFVVDDILDEFLQMSDYYKDEN